MNQPPKSAGRPKGSTNKTSMKRVAEILNSANIHPVKELIDLMDHLEPKERATVWLHLLRYCEAYAIPKPSDGAQELPVITYTKVESGG